MTCEILRLRMDLWVCGCVGVCGEGVERLGKIVTCESKLQALVYDILPLEEGVGKRCSECVVKV